MVGLDAAGKTTILYKLKLGEGMEYYPSKSLISVDQALLGFHAWIVPEISNLSHIYSCLLLSPLFSGYHHSYHW